MYGRRRGKGNIRNREHETSQNESTTKKCPCNVSNKDLPYLDSSKACLIFNTKYLFHRKCAEDYGYKSLKKDKFSPDDLLDPKNAYYCNTCNDTVFKCDCGKRHGIMIGKEYFIAHCNKKYKGKNGHWFFGCEKW